MTEYAGLKEVGARAAADRRSIYWLSFADFQSNGRYFLAWNWSEAAGIAKAMGLEPMKLHRGRRDNPGIKHATNVTPKGD